MKYVFLAALIFLLGSCKGFDDGGLYKDDDVLQFKPGDTIYVYAADQVRQAVVVANDKKAKMVKVNLLIPDVFETMRFFRYSDL